MLNTHPHVEFSYTSLKNLIPPLKFHIPLLKFQTPPLKFKTLVEVSNPAVEVYSPSSKSPTYGTNGQPDGVEQQSAALTADVDTEKVTWLRLILRR